MIDINTDDWDANLLIDILCLLPNDYLELDIEIFIASTYKFAKSLCTTHDELHSLKSKVVLGGYVAEKDKILLFDFKLKKHKYREHVLVNALLHEIHHAYQFQYSPEKYIEAVTNYTHPEMDVEKYREAWIEKDAIEFSENFLHSYRSVIEEIFQTYRT